MGVGGQCHAPLYPRETVTVCMLCTGGWAGPRASLVGVWREKKEIFFFLHQVSNSEHEARANCVLIWYFAPCKQKLRPSFFLRNSFFRGNIVPEIMLNGSSGGGRLIVNKLLMYRS